MSTDAPRGGAATRRRRSSRTGDPPSDDSAFDAWYTLLLGIVLMLGSVVAGVLVTADPAGFLDHDREDATQAERDGTADAS
jgi:hypothetical protein